MTALAARPCVIAWTTSGARARDLAVALGGDVLVLATLGRRGIVRTLVGYALDGVRTVAWIVRHRPGSIVVQNPPIVPALIATAWGRIARVPVVLDSHTGSFGLKGDGVARRLLAVHRALARRAAAVLVPSAPLAAQVERWGGRAIVLHDPPPTVPAPAPAWTASGTRPRVLYAGLLAADEPVAAVLAGARLVPGVDVVICGDPGSRRALLSALAPPNVRLVGFLQPAAYADQITAADAILALTTQAESVMRVACEAVWHRRPLIVSDSPAARAAFPFATSIEPTAAGVAEGLTAIAVSLASRRATVDAARDVQAARFEGQITAVRTVLGRLAP